VRILANYKKILRTGMVMSGLLLAGAALPAVAQNSVDRGTTTDHDRGFHDWGLLGLVGLAGLLGRKREREVTHRGTVPNTGRV
jgi:MYXO-CTERM domain-containing protein